MTKRLARWSPDVSKDYIQMDKLMGQNRKGYARSITSRSKQSSTKRKIIISLASVKAMKE